MRLRIGATDEREEQPGTGAEIEHASWQSIADLESVDGRAVEGVNAGMSRRRTALY